MTETSIYVWTDRAEHAYVVMRERGGHWNVEWGYRDPPGSDHYVEHGEHTTSVGSDAARRMCDRVREMSDQPEVDVPRAERELATVLTNRRR
jgi:hypothetical protein